MRLPGDQRSLGGADTSGDQALALNLYRAELKDAASREYKVAETLKNNDVLARRLAQESEESDGPGTASERQKVDRKSRSYAQVARATKSASSNPVDSSASPMSLPRSAVPHHTRSMLLAEASSF